MLHIVDFNSLDSGQVTTCLVCGGVNTRGGTERRAHDKKRRRRGGGEGRPHAAGFSGEDTGARHDRLNVFLRRKLPVCFFRGVKLIGELQSGSPLTVFLPALFHLGR